MTNARENNDDTKYSPERNYGQKNKFESDKVEYTSRVDHELIRLRKDITTQYEMLNDKLHRLKFEAQRSKQNRDEEKRDFDHYVKEIRNRPLFSRYLDILSI